MIEVDHFGTDPEIMYELTPPTRDGTKDQGDDSDDNGRESPAQAPPQRESNNEKLMVSGHDIKYISTGHQR